MLLLPASLALALVAPVDELLVSSFQPAAVRRHGLPGGGLELSYAASPLNGTLGMDAGPDGMVYVASEGTDEILRFDPTSGAYLGPFVWDDPATGVDESGGLDAPSAVLFGPDGKLYVASFTLDSVLRYDGRTGAFLDVFVQPGDGNLDGPDAGMSFGSFGDLYVPSYWNDRVKRYDATTGAFVENFLKPSPSGLKNPRQVLFHGAYALATSEGSDQVLRFDALTGAFLDVLVGDDPATGMDESGGLDGPTGMAVTPEGLVVASIQSDEVKLYELSTGLYLGDLITGVALPTFLRTRPRVGTVCDGAPNSVGDGTTLAAKGSTRISGGGLQLDASYGPPGEPAVFFRGSVSTFQAVGDGTLCIAAPQLRIATVPFGPDGRASLGFDPTALGVAPGESWFFQVGYRDPGGPGGTDLNFSASLRAVFTP